VNIYQPRGSLLSIGKTQEERIEYWQRQIRFATDRIKPHFEAADVLIKQYQNDPSSEREQHAQDQSNTKTHLSRVKTSLVFGWVDQSIANLLERNPSFSVNAQSKDSVDGAPVVTAVSNYWYRETGQRRQDERALLDAFLTPWGVKKLGWTTDVEQRVGDVIHQLQGGEEYDFQDDVESETLFLLTGQPQRVMDGHDHDTHIEAHTIALQDPEIDGVIAEIIKSHISLHKKFMDRADPDRNTSVQWESPFGVRWPPDDFLIDPLAQDGINDAQWIAFRSHRRLDDVRSNPNYENIEGLEASTRPDDAPSGFSGGDMEDDFGMVEIWEIWARDFPFDDGRRDMLWVMADGHDKFLREDEEWPYKTIENYPVEVLNLQNTVSSWVTKPGLAMAGADSIQGLANEILDSYLNVIRKSKNIILYDSDILEQDEIDNMLQAPDMTMFPVRGMSKAQGSAVQAVDFGRVPSEKGEMLSLIQQFFDRSAGTPQPIAIPKQDTATEASIHERRTSAREARRGSLLAEFQINTAKKFWQMTTQFRPERLFLIHPQASQWAEVSDDIAKGEYRFKIDVSSHQANLALERKNHLDLLNLFAGLNGIFQQQYGQPVNLAKIAERLLTRGYGEQSPEEILPMLQDQQGQDSMDPLVQQAIAGILEGSPSQVPTGGPTLDGPPQEVEAENQIGPALPRQFNRAASSPSNESASSETV